MQEVATNTGNSKTKKNSVNDKSWMASWLMIVELFDSKTLKGHFTAPLLTLYIYKLFSPFLFVCIVTVSNKKCLSVCLPVAENNMIYNNNT